MLGVFAQTGYPDHVRQIDSGLFLVLREMIYFEPIEGSVYSFADPVFGIKWSWCPPLEKILF
jgi:hypothetical protein